MVEEGLFFFSLKEDQLLTFTVLSWGIWGSRNGKMHNGSPLQLVIWGSNYLNWIKSVYANESTENTTNEFVR